MMKKLGTKKVLIKTQKLIISHFPADDTPNHPKQIVYRLSEMIDKHPIRGAIREASRNIPGLEFPTESFNEKELPPGYLSLNFATELKRFVEGLEHAIGDGRLSEHSYIILSSLHQFTSTLRIEENIRVIPSPPIMLKMCDLCFRLIPIKKKLCSYHCPKTKHAEYRRAKRIKSRSAQVFSKKKSVAVAKAVSQKDPIALKVAIDTNLPLTSKILFEVSTTDWNEFIRETFTRLDVTSTKFMPAAIKRAHQFPNLLAWHEVEQSRAPAKAGRPPSPESATVLEMKKSGMRPSEIARATGKSRQNVYGILKRTENDSQQDI